MELPDGRFLAAVSGGADSVAMLYRCFGAVGRVVHVNHELRGSESELDADFVRSTCARLGVALTVVRKSEVPEAGSSTSAAALRRLRLGVYRRLCDQHGLDGVLLAHHADDQAETIAIRLLRGSTYEGLAGMSEDAVVAGVRLVRPMLGLRRVDLRKILAAAGQSWREDSSNRSDTSGRNRVRRLLQQRPALVEPLLDLQRACTAYRAAMRQVAGRVAQGETLRVGEIGRDPVGRSAGRRWLSRRIAGEAVTPSGLERFLAWCEDAAGPSRLSLPGDIEAVRSRQWIRLESKQRQ